MDEFSSKDERLDSYRAEIKALNKKVTGLEEDIKQRDNKIYNLLTEKTSLKQELAMILTDSNSVACILQDIVKILDRL